ncbi:squalene synthase HpnC [Ottowia sp.]|uniref:squalene synthase HpnC n=1 Tax=Ottowia sp. TaxID=1898956 RepID=UPI002C75CADF|nr:squalene synthase HpnC [Ottowia sp.]HPZ58749.1 squalene synthase HpnC [Ottowia sp.]HQD47828.1 squalene synthase HpnC [Ottowia sp.]
MPRPAPPSAIDHYENFPVASWLCPPHLRPPITAIYHFARTADDIADEGVAPAAQRLADLAAYRADLHAVAAGQAPSPRWASIFAPLAVQMRAFGLPVQPLDDLLSAFAQDVVKTRDGAAYADMDELRDYCRRSANPVGRLLLHLYGVHDTQALHDSDAICTALQLINFWQDLSVDIPRGRYYLPLAECAAHGVVITHPATQFAALRSDEKTTQLIAACADQASASLQKGAKLVHRVPGRAGWELRAVVQGARRVLDKMAAQGHRTLEQRPTLGKADAPLIAWRMLWM